MGTSTKWPGPSRGPWSNASRQTTQTVKKVIGQASPPDDGSSSAPSGQAAAGAAGNGVGPVNGRLDGIASSEVLSPERAAELAELYRSALIQQLRTDQDSYGLRQAVNAHATRFVEVLTSLRETSWGQHPDHLDLDQPSGPDRLLELLTASICLDEPGYVNAAIRPGVVLTISKLTHSPASRRRARSGQALIDDELLCFLYREFFADAITEFLTSVIAAKLNVAVPLLLVIDPTGQISQYLASKIVEAIPTPCEEKNEGGTHDPLTSIAQDMVSDTFDRWLEAS
ncbi:hypothetical protein ACWGID_31435 [Kribbella sp. NPDC054772]